MTPNIWIPIGDPFNEKLHVWEGPFGRACFVTDFYEHTPGIADYTDAEGFQRHYKLTSPLGPLETSGILNGLQLSSSCIGVVYTRILRGQNGLWSEVVRAYGLPESEAHAQAVEDAIHFNSITFRGHQGLHPEVLEELPQVTLTRSLDVFDMGLTDGYQRALNEGIMTAVSANLATLILGTSDPTRFS